MQQERVARANQDIIWTRSPHGLLAGVCQGVAEKIGVDPLIVRVLWLGFSLFFGLGILLYITLYLAFPRRDQVDRAFRSKLLGACYQLSLRTGWDLGLIRLSALWLLLASAGAAILLYVLLFFLLRYEH